MNSEDYFWPSSALQYGIALLQYTIRHKLAKIRMFQYGVAILDAILNNSKRSMMPAGHHSDSDSTLLPPPKSSITWFGGIFARLRGKCLLGCWTNSARYAQPVIETFIHGSSMFRPCFVHVSSMVYTRPAYPGTLQCTHF